MKKTVAALTLLSSLSAFAQTAPATNQSQATDAQGLLPRSSRELPAPAVRDSRTSAQGGNVVNDILGNRAAGPAAGAMSRVDGGSGIGGGSVYEGLMSWCSQASGILIDARTQASEAWGMRGDAVEALSLYVDGLRLALESAAPEQSAGQTFTLRYVQRGLTLSQILGVDYLIHGQAVAGRSTNALVTFFEWYLQFTSSVGEQLDRPLYVPYISSRGCRNGCGQVPRVSTMGLESKTVDLSISALRTLDAQFVRTLPDRSNLYSTIGVPNYLRALSFLLVEVSKDLEDSLFAESYVCQAARMNQLSAQIQRYLNSRSGSAQDAIKLNGFSVTLRNILSNLNRRACN